MKRQENLPGATRKFLYLRELRTGRKQAEREGRELSQGLSESETKRFRLKRSQE